MGWMSWVTIAAGVITMANIAAAIYYMRKTSRIRRRIAELNAPRVSPSTRSSVQGLSSRGVRHQADGTR